jgi:ADP-ribose pyrophosphatase
MYKKLVFSLVALVPSFLTSSEESRKKYLDLVFQYPHIVSPQGEAIKGEIQILLDPAKMEEIEKATGRDVGIVHQDAYWIWLNDACRFPSGKEGVYGRILWVGSLYSLPAVCVMPILPDGRVVLNCNFRHSTRSWEIELPRGLVDKGESLEMAAQREALEETGMVLDHIWEIGKMPTDVGSMSLVVPIFAAKVKAQEGRHHEDSEAIEEILALTIEEMQTAFKQGYHCMAIRGEEKKISFRDPFLAYALAVYVQ